ncbi:ATP-binding protein [Psychromonas aquatilis]|uniref:ATP-binding protein n=1 Tax=Psychromonas aquatilis TaxID=2005072 RepID=A0ABU9GSG5_9GAMM
MTQLTLTLIRGLPGSGKTTLAEKMLSESMQKLVHLEADMYFVDKNGQYLFQPHLIKEAHEWCLTQSRAHLLAGENVVVANTFVRHWEMQAYRDLAVMLNAKLVIKVCRGKYKNIHQVPGSTIKRMQKQWQP